jgi:hypothetical protein
MDTAPADLAARIVDEQFLQLICGDPELLAAEFDAIIAAEWPAPPTDEGEPKATSGPPGGRARTLVAWPVDGLVTRPRHPGVGGWARQRSPPARAHESDDRKGGDRPT